MHTKQVPPLVDALTNLLILVGRCRGRIMFRHPGEVKRSSRRRWSTQRFVWRNCMDVFRICLQKERSTSRQKK